MYKRANLAKGELSAQLLIGGTSLILESGQGTIFPATGSGNIFTGMIWGASYATPFDDSTHEIVTAYRSSGDTFTITRAQESTSAKQWEIGDNFMLTMTSGALGDLVSETTTSASSKATPVDADTIPLVDSAASNVIKSLSWSNIKATLLTWLSLSTTIIPQNSPRGVLINGKLSVLDSAGITVAVKTLAGTDPSSSDPVYIRIGDTVRSITSSLSRSLADGTNWFNAGSAELATKEVDYFTYLVWDSNSSAVGLTFARIPGANLVSDFSSTTTNEKYCAGYSDFTSTDEVEVIGRFAATLSAGAGYTWTVPTFTAANLIQRPIYETRWLTCVPVITGGTAPTYTAQFLNRYKITGDILQGTYSWSNSSGGTAGSGANNINITLPFGISATASGTAASRYTIGTGFAYEGSGTLAGFWANINGTTANQVYIFKSDLTSLQANDQSSTDRALVIDFRYEI